TAALHTIIEAMKLAFLDRYAYVGDRDHVPVPYDGLISSVYASERAALIDPERAKHMRPGDPWPHQASGKRLYETLGVDVDALTGRAPTAIPAKDTTRIAAADKDRNGMRITSSNVRTCKAVVPRPRSPPNNTMACAH